MTREPENDEAPIDVDALGWEAHEPPQGFAERVATAFAGESEPEAAREPVRAGRRWQWVAAAVAVAAACALWIAIPGEATRDSLDTEVLRTVEIRDRGLAVAQPGTRMRWEVEADGTTRVVQDAGRVFYRVDDGEAFEVRTPAGVVHVTGTCFEVDLERGNKHMNRQGLKAGVLGAALASALLVTVYEGRVVLANDDGEVALGPGERGRAGDSSAPSRWDDDGDDPSGNGGIAEGEGSLAEVEIPPGVDPVEVVRSQARTLERLRAEKEAQYEELEALRQQVGQSASPGSPEAVQARAEKCATQSRGGECPFLEPDQDTLLEMAKCATVKIDYPAFLEQFDAPQTRGYAEDLGITDPQEQAALQSAAERHHEAVANTLREIYLELGGDEEFAGSASPSTLEAYIRDQVDQEALGNVQRRIAQERAGLREPPAPGAELSIEERFWRLRAELGNDFEQHVASALGPERAHELRSVHDGWPGSTSVHSSDCVD
jgi:ferric-dicitrate binding protein FerR (iron transport regulator)